MAVIKTDLADGLMEYAVCEKCDAPLDRLVISGVGDWQKAIHCSECLHVRGGVSFDTLVALKARQTGMPKVKVKADLESAQQEYLEALAIVEEFD